MTYEAQEIKLRTRVHRMLHRQRQLRANNKKISKKTAEGVRIFDESSIARPNDPVAREHSRKTTNA